MGPSQHMDSLRDAERVASGGKTQAQSRMSPYKKGSNGVPARSSRRHSQEEPGVLTNNVKLINNSAYLAHEKVNNHLDQHLSENGSKKTLQKKQSK